MLRAAEEAKGRTRNLHAAIPSSLGSRNVCCPSIVSGCVLVVSVNTTFRTMAVGIVDRAAFCHADPEWPAHADDQNNRDHGSEHNQPHDNVAPHSCVASLTASAPPGRTGARDGSTVVSHSDGIPICRLVPGIGTMSKVPSKPRKMGSGMPSVNVLGGGIDTDSVPASGS